MNGRTRVALHGGIATIAAASALGSVFDGYGWLLPVAGAVIVVVIISELVRWSPAPSAFGPLLAAGGLLVYLTAVYAGSEAWWGFVPNDPALELLGDTARDGFQDVQKLATPVPTKDGLVLITAVGIAMVALIVDLIAVTMRKAALAGLPLLSIFALCTSLAKDGAGWVPFSIGTTGYLWLLLADSRDRLARWGRPMGFDREARPRFNWSDSEVMPSPLSVMGRRIGLSAIAIAVVVPLLLPGLRGGVPHRGGGSGFGLGGDGSQSATTINPIVSITSQLQQSSSKQVLRIQTTDPDPGYLRLTALDQFDGRTFRPSTLAAPESARVSEGMAAPSIPGNAQSSHIEIGEFEAAWLPLPQQVVGVEVDGDWRYEPVSNTVFSARDNTDGLSYDVTSISPNWTAADLQQAGAATFDDAIGELTDLPEIPPSVATLTRQVTAGAASPFDKAVKIQHFLTSSPFQYDLTSPQTDSGDALAQFLIVTHRGFCQQFATSMAVMARIVDIPSRIAVGFTRGEHQPDGSWLVTSKDAHAWPELYLSGYGWVPFEPTPRGDGQAQQPDYTASGSAAEPDPTAPKGQDGKSGKANPQPGVDKHDRLDDSLDGFPGLPPITDDGTSAGGTPVRQILLWVAAGLLAALLIVPSVARVWTRRRRWAHAVTPGDRANAAWEELRATAIDARTGWVDGLSPRATARALRMEAGGLATAEVRALQRIVDAVERAWYAPARSTAGAADTLEDDVTSLRIAMFSESTLRERFVLHAWPRSTMREAAALFGRVGAGLDAADMAGARLRARLSPRHAS